MLSDWKAVGGVQIAHTRSCRLSGIEVGAADTETDVAVNPTQLASTTFAAPDSVKDGERPRRPNVPYQWVLRRIFLSRFLDSDDIILPAGRRVEAGRAGAQRAARPGRGGNNLIVAMKDHLVVFDAPYGEKQSRWVDRAAKAKYPGKPIKYLVLTHHHMDHTGGMRTYVAEGATIVVPEGSEGGCSPRSHGRSTRSRRTPSRRPATSPPRSSR